MGENTVQFGTGGSDAWWRRFTRRTVLIPLFAVLFIAIGVWVFMQLSSKSDDKEATIDNIIKASDAAFQTGDYQKSLEQLQAATDKAKSDEEKIVLYSNMAAAAASSGNMTQAIKYLEEKHKIAPETEEQDAYLLGTYYERTGDNSRAIEYYKKALVYEKKRNVTEGQGSSADDLEERIKHLEASL